jgi:hypothetical protein
MECIGKAADVLHCGAACEAKRECTAQDTQALCFGPAIQRCRRNQPCNLVPADNALYRSCTGTCSMPAGW